MNFINTNILIQQEKSSQKCHGESFKHVISFVWEKLCAIVNLVNKINDMTKSKHARPRRRHEIKPEITFYTIGELTIAFGICKEGSSEAHQIIRYSDVSTTFILI